MTPAQFQAAIDQLGLSQQAVARLWGVNPRTVRRWVAGDQDVPEWAAYAFAGMLSGGRLRAMAV